MKRSLYLSLYLSPILFATEVGSLPSFQGFKGAVNTPNASVYEEGEFEFLHSNQVDALSTTLNLGDDPEQKNYFLNMGLLPNLDLTFRYTSSPNKISDAYDSDLSDRMVNIKYQLPFIPDNLFQVAVGMKDVGGGLSRMNSTYGVVSKDFKNIRTSVGYSIGDKVASLDGVFGSVEYQPFTWLNVAGEYDTQDWNAALKANYLAQVGKQKINFGLMAAGSTNENGAYVGLYTNIPFNDKSKHLKASTKNIPSSIAELKDYGFSNISYKVVDDILYFEYENTLYTYSDIDALGVVLGTLAMSNKASNIVVVTKKSNIKKLTTKVNAKEYKKFLETGKYTCRLLKFSATTMESRNNFSHSDILKPTLTLKPDFVLVDGSEYGHMDYSLAMQAELSMRLAKGTILSARYNIPLSITDNFDDGGVFDYRNRNKTKAEVDQILLSQYLQLDLPYRWINLVQVGQFDKELTGGSIESRIGTLDGKHALTAKATQLKDNMYKQMDRYGNEEYREERLLSYRYYLESLNSNIELTAGEFLYGDYGTMFSLQRYFSDTIVQFDISQTEHEIKGENTVAKLSLSIPFGTSKKIKTKYLDIQGDYLSYNRRKTITSGEASYAQPHHLKEVENSFTLEKYYLNSDRFHPTYIKKNFNRLRNVFIGN